MMLDRLGRARWCPRSSPRTPDRSAGAAPGRAAPRAWPSRRQARARAESAWSAARPWRWRDAASSANSPSITSTAGRTIARICASSSALARLDIATAMAPAAIAARCIATMSGVSSISMPTRSPALHAGLAQSRGELADARGQRAVAQRLRPRSTAPDARVRRPSARAAGNTRRHSLDGVGRRAPAATTSTISTAGCAVGSTRVEPQAGLVEQRARTPARCARGRRSAA